MCGPWTPKGRGHMDDDVLPANSFSLLVDYWKDGRGHVTVSLDKVVDGEAEDCPDVRDVSDESEFVAWLVKSGVKPSVAEPFAARRWPTVMKWASGEHDSPI